MRTAWIAMRRLAVGVCASIGLVFLLATFTPFVPWYARILAGPWTDPKGDTLIVLAGSSLDGFPEQNTLLRCYYAVLAYNAGDCRNIVVAGRRVSRHMRNLLAAEGVPERIVLLEDASTSTRENALYTARLLRGNTGSRVLLTSDYHMFRAVRCFRKAGFEISPRPIPDVLKRSGRRLNRWSAFLELTLETLKIGYYYARGWI